MANTRYIRHLHAFRGFSILTIVGAHAWSLAIFWTGGLNGPGLDSLFAVTETLFHGSTLYFAIISGLLFSQVLHARSWPQFYRGKLLNVFMPYVTMSLLMTALLWGNTVSQNPQANFLSTLAGALLNGKASIHLWYMPVLFALFGITPLMTRLMAIPQGQWLIGVLMLAPLVISRSPFPDFIKPQTFVYFAGAYAVGIAAGANYSRVQAVLYKHWYWLVLLAIVTSGAIYLGYFTEQHNEGIFRLRQSLIYLQKISFTFLLLHFLQRKEMQLPHWLSTLGDYSFAVYFLHVLVIGYLIHWNHDWLQLHRTVKALGLFGLLCGCLSILGSMTLAWCMRKCLGRHSRKWVGA